MSIFIFIFFSHLFFSPCITHLHVLPSKRCPVEQCHRRIEAAALSAVSAVPPGGRHSHWQRSAFHRSGKLCAPAPVATPDFCRPHFNCCCCRCCLCRQLSAAPGCAQTQLQRSAAQRRPGPLQAVEACCAH